MIHFYSGIPKPISEGLLHRDSHFNTGHPHTHIVIRGRDDKGGDLVIARDYISQGLRERARDLATLELGPESADSLPEETRA